MTVLIPFHRFLYTSSTSFVHPNYDLSHAIPSAYQGTHHIGFFFSSSFCFRTIITTSMHLSNIEHGLSRCYVVGHLTQASE